MYRNVKLWSCRVPIFPTTPSLPVKIINTWNYKQVSTLCWDQAIPLPVWTHSPSHVPRFSPVVSAQGQGPPFQNHYSQPLQTRHILTFKNTIVLKDVREPWATWSTTLGRLLITNSYMGHILLCKHGAGAQAVHSQAVQLSETEKVCFTPHGNKSVHSCPRWCHSSHAFSNCHLHRERRKRVLMQSWACL